MSYYSKKNDDLSFTPFTVEEEIELFRRYMASEKGAESADSLAARDSIIANHLKLVAKLSLRLAARFRLSEDDIISAGNLGLMKALNARRFDPSRGIRFCTYIREYVRSEVLDVIEKHIKGQRDLHCGSAWYDSNPTPDTVANAEDRADRALTGISAFHQYKETVPRIEHTWAEEEITLMRSGVIEEAMKTLSEVEKHIVNAHYFDGKTLAAAGREINMGRNGAREAHKRGMAKLKAVLPQVAQAELC